MPSTRDPSVFDNTTSTQERFEIVKDLIDNDQVRISDAGTLTVRRDMGVRFPADSVPGPRNNDPEWRTCYRNDLTDTIGGHAAYQQLKAYSQQQQQAVNGGEISR